jgi:hypothetical protein
MKGLGLRLALALASGIGIGMIDLTRDLLADGARVLLTRAVGVGDGFRAETAKGHGTAGPPGCRPGWRCGDGVGPAGGGPPGR